MKKRQDLLVLLAAGSSYPYISGVKSLTDFLLQWTGDDGYFRDPSTQEPIFRTLYNAIAAENGYEPNFEELIHACEVLASLSPSALRMPPHSVAENAQSTVLSAFVHLREQFSYLGALPRDWFAQAAENVCAAILGEVRHECLKAKEAGHAPAVIGVLNQLAEDFRLRVFSLNYDDLALASSVRFYTGFEEESASIGAAFRPDRPWPTDRDAFCQLHGSVRWGYDPDNLSSTRIVSSSDLREVRLRSPSGIYAQDRHPLSIGPMIAGLRKADKVMDEPYALYFEALRQDLFRCNRWLIMGYGFGDLHVNACMRHAEQYWQGEGKAPTAVVVDYEPKISAEPIEFDWFYPEIGAPLRKKLIRVFTGAFREEDKESGTHVSAMKGKPVVVGGQVQIWLDGIEEITGVMRNVIEFLRPC